MTEDEINNLDAPANCKKRKTVMDDYLNIIYKMLKDKIKPEIIMAYIIKRGYDGNVKTLDNYMTLLAKNNFNVWLPRNWAYDFSYPDDVIVIRRRELFKYMTTKNLKTKRTRL